MKSLTVSGVDYGGGAPPTAPAEAPRPRQAKIMGPWGPAFFYKIGVTK